MNAWMIFEVNCNKKKRQWTRLITHFEGGLSQDRNCSSKVFDWTELPKSWLLALWKGNLNKATSKRPDSIKKGSFSELEIQKDLIKVMGIFSPLGDKSGVCTCRNCMMWGGKLKGHFIIRLKPCSPMISDHKNWPLPTAPQEQFAYPKKEFEINTT